MIFQGIACAHNYFSKMFNPAETQQETLTQLTILPID